MSFTKTFTGIPDSRTPAQIEADSLMEIGENRFFRNVQETMQEVQSFWYKNGAGNLEGDFPSGMEKLQAMGTEAKKFWDLAVARYAMIAMYAQQHPEVLGQVNFAALDAPYTMAFNPDGTVDVAGCVLKIQE